ncbi:hypothetical protein [Roseateles albus]|uniref:DUF2846 domain-containing protein n=1 Tax=Roseateles albus TaxID=2987525 RepID=A0ABT5KAS6_9BURK|nr:hypothetical protein [Roseateles albus]MDC8770534.1 hypothetical protein [Roseateles albus]
MKITAVFLSLLFALLCGTGCATKPLEFPPPVALQDPLPDHAIVYLLRIPNDPATVDVRINSKSMAVLPEATYTVVTLSPGVHEVATKTMGASDTGRIFPLELQAGQRRFFYVSVPTTVTTTMSEILGTPIRKNIPFDSAIVVPTGPRTWTECSEMDAQGLMSTSRPVAPKPNAA